MKKFVSICIFLITLVPVSQATMNLDSLRQDLSRTEPDSLGFQKCLKFFSRVGSDERAAKMMVAEWLIVKSSEVEDYDVLARTYHFLGHTMMMEQNYDKATDYFNTALLIAEKNELYGIMGRVYNSYGMMYYQFNQLDKSIENYKNAIKYAQMTDNHKSVGTYYFNLAGMYYEMGRNSQDTLLMAINVAKTAIRMETAEKDTFGLITSKNGLAKMYISINKLDTALQELKESGEFIEKLGLEEKYIIHYLRLAEVYLAKKDYQKAIDFLDQGMFYLRKYSDKRWEYSYYDFYSQAYAGLDNFEKAYDYKERYVMVHDSIVTEENYAIADEFLTRYESERKEKEILELNKDNEIKQLRLQQEEATQSTLKIILVSATVVLILSITLSVFLIRSNINRKQVNTELEKKNIEIQKQSGVLNEQSKLISRYQSQMNPHFVFNALNNIQGLVIHDQKTKTISQLQLLSRLMRDTLNNSERDFVLLSDELDYLKRYLDFEQVKFTTPVTFNIEVPANANELLIPPMMIQPFIENAVRHGALHKINAPEITLEIQPGEDVLRITVSDNGQGFDSSDESFLKNSHAMSMIRTRLYMIWEISGNTVPDTLFVIKSKPVLNQGTIVEFYLPLKYRY